MKENKKNIDRLFQEKFRDFEASPSEKNWDQIREKLIEKKDSRKRLFPIWFKIAGIAAVLLVLFMVGSFWFNTDQNPTVVSQEEVETPEQTQKSISRSQSDKDKIDQTNFESEHITDDDTEMTGQNLVSSENNEAKSESKQFTQKEDKSKRASDLAKAETTTQYEIENNNQETSLIDFLSVLEEEKRLNRNVGGIMQTEKLAEASITENPELIESEGKSLFDEIEKQETLDKDEQNTSTLSNRFAIRPNVAPIYYNSMKGGSAVDPSFAGNKSEGEVTMSYGIDVSYAVSKRVKVRTGVSKVNMSYNTPDIAYIASSGSQGLKSVRNNPEARNISVVTKNAILKRPGEVSNNSAAPYTFGKLNQQLEYIEVPVEVELAVLDKRFGINVIGGASTLFLKDDLVRLNSEMGTTNLGRANNLNSVSFTTNIGVGLEYNITETFNLNIEPTFKYQINGFSGDNGGFKPYFFGVYSGVSMRF
ncbi:MAG TPA: hypothetical protein VK021_03570 [Flavobacteriaceae bacterium]|nr:hypothetical protein [Flavobacteriaceae bacterium]